MSAFLFIYLLIAFVSCLFWMKVLAGRHAPLRVRLILPVVAGFAWPSIYAFFVAWYLIFPLPRSQ